MAKHSGPQVWKCCVASALLWAIGCGAEPASAPAGANGQSPGTNLSDSAAQSMAPTLVVPMSQPIPKMMRAGAAGTPAAPGGSPNTATPNTPNTPVAMQPPPGTGAPPAGGAMMPTGTVPPPPTMFTGPLDGDTSKPMVAIDGIPCGAPRAGFGATPPSVKITDRDVVVAYPCAHEGAAVTFFLFIHGTLQEAQKVAFTMSAFPVHEYVDSHNFIVVVPKAVGTQWGNGDNGADAPHLAEVVDWVYAQFGTKFDIRSMWASGGSWGAFYLGNTFACDPKYEDRLRGVRMVVGGGCPRCSNRLSCIVAQQELELGMGEMLSDAEKEMATINANIEPYAMQHGCDAKMGPTNLGPVRGWNWGNCDPGWVHSYYLGPGNHADPWSDPTAMMHMVEEIKSTEL
jgi:hypothetical protein